MLKNKTIFYDEEIIVIIKPSRYRSRDKDKNLGTNEMHKHY